MAVLGGHTSSVSAVTLCPGCRQRGSDDSGGDYMGSPTQGQDPQDTQGTLHPEPLSPPRGVTHFRWVFSSVSLR